MAFTDELTVHARAGKGGDGVVRWLHTRQGEFGGPAGGNGGRGGNVYVVAVRDVHLLAKYKNKKEFVADDGVAGRKKSEYGENAKDLDILLPIGSIITKKESGETFSLTQEGERVLILKGGYGGRGNESFKSSVNRSPEQFTPGGPGEEDTLYIELQLIADIGFIGLPNAGKTSLLNEMTNAKGKIGDYPFTTLEPNLGEWHGFIISDIPGLIEGAAEGKGLGHKFLRHVRRTKVLVHLVSLENEDMGGAYETIRKELKEFDSVLDKKHEIVVITKTDLIADQKELKKKLKEIKKVVPYDATVTIYDDEQVKALGDMLIKEIS